MKSLVLFKKWLVQMLELVILILEVCELNLFSGM